MNVISAVVPLAINAWEVAAQQVSEVVHSSVSFAHLLQDHLAGEKPSAASPSADAAADKGPDQTGLAQQVQRETLRQRVESLRETVQRELLPRLAERGIDLSEPAILTADAQGRLLEAGGHWDRAQIEQLLADDKPLGDRVRELLQQASVWQAVGRSEGEAPASNAFRLVASKDAVLLQSI